jgi:hypothetical protein
MHSNGDRCIILMLRPSIISGDKTMHIIGIIVQYYVSKV